MALISIVEKQFVERLKLIKSEELLDVISIASMLPGPMAVNVVAYIGYKLRGMKGAIISMTAVLLPTLILILVLSHLYFQYGSLPQVDSIFKGIIPAVCAIIIAVALNMAKKNFNEYKALIICSVAALLLIVIGGFYITLFIMLSAGITGWIVYAPKPMKSFSGKVSGIKKNRFHVLMDNRVFFLSLLGFTSIIILSSFIFNIQDHIFLQHRSLLITFGGVSLTLFGGGYVFIPVLQELVVDQLHWVSTKEFVDGIAMGQITPGPIMISAAFIGYKVAGISGAIISTIAIFLPPALLMIIVSSFIDDIKNSLILNAVFKGVRAAVIGMIFAAGWLIGTSIGFELLPFAIMIVVFILTYWLKVNVVYLIPLSGLLGLILF